MNRAKKILGINEASAKPQIGNLVGITLNNPESFSHGVTTWGIVCEVSGNKVTLYAYGVTEDSKGKTPYEHSSVKKGAVIQKHAGKFSSNESYDVTVVKKFPSGVI